MTQGSDTGEGRRVLASYAWGDRTIADVQDVTTKALHARVEHLDRCERLAVRYLRALDGNLGPLDSETPEEALGRLRAHLKDSMTRSDV